MAHKAVIEEVIVAANGKEAIDALEEYDYAFDALLLDIVMPELDGIELLSYLHRVDARIPIVLVSGHPDNILEVADKLGRSLQLPITRMVEKPMSMSMMKAIAQDCVTSSG